MSKWPGRSFQPPKRSEMEAESQSEPAVTIAPPRAPQRGEQLPLRQWEGSSEGRVGGVAAPCAPEHAAQPVVVDRATP